VTKHKFAYKVDVMHRDKMKWYEHFDAKPNHWYQF